MVQIRREHPEREDARYLELRGRGKKIRDIAFLCGVDAKTIRNGIKAAKERQKQAAEVELPPRPKQPAWVREMVPLFGVAEHTPDSPCPHKKPIARESMLVCMKCHQSAMDHMAALRPDSRQDPKEEVELPKPKPKVAAQKEWVDPKAKPKPKPKHDLPRRERRRTQAAA